MSAEKLDIPTKRIPRISFRSLHAVIWPKPFNNVRLRIVFFMKEYRHNACKIALDLKKENKKEEEKMSLKSFLFFIQ